MSDGFERRKEQSKEEIRKAACELFGRFGVERVSIADIARRARVSQATIYNNFGSKDALVREFVAVSINQLVKRFQGFHATDLPFRERMTGFVRFISQEFEEGQIGGAAGFSLGDYDLLDDPEIRKIREAAQEKMSEMLLELVREGKAAGEIRGDLSEDAFRVYFRVFMAVFIDPQVRHLHRQDPKLASDLSSLMLFGMSGSHARSW
jgi:AcrR family transcriptional regulator